MFDGLFGEIVVVFAQFACQAGWVFSVEPIKVCAYIYSSKDHTLLQNIPILISADAYSLYFSRFKYKKILVSSDMIP